MSEASGVLSCYIVERYSVCGEGLLERFMLATGKKAIGMTSGTQCVGSNEVIIGIIRFDIDMSVASSDPMH